jgi:hypothetical protein
LRRLGLGAHCGTHELHALTGVLAPGGERAQRRAGGVPSLADPDRLAAGRGALQARPEVHDLVVEVVPQLAELVRLARLGRVNHPLEIGMVVSGGVGVGDGNGRAHRQSLRQVDALNSVTPLARDMVHRALDRP